MHVQTRFVTSNLDLYLCPLAWNEVYIALVLLRELLAQSLPGKLRERDVLGRMVAPHLIVGTSVCRANVEAFILCRFRRDAEGNADKAPRPLSRIGAGFARQLYFDHTVLKFSLTQYDEPLSISDACGRRVGHPQRFLPLVSDSFHFYVARLHPVDSA